MGRLIDAEALASELYKHHVHDDEELEPLVYLADAEKVIANAPTVDAIPVEWMIEKLMDLRNKDRALSRAAWLVLHTWRKEQEVQNG